MSSDWNRREKKKRWWKFYTKKSIIQVKKNHINFKLREQKITLQRRRKQELLSPRKLNLEISYNMLQSYNCNKFILGYLLKSVIDKFERKMNWALNKLKNSHILRWEIKNSYLLSNLTLVVCFVMCTIVCIFWISIYLLLTRRCYK